MHKQFLFFILPVALTFSIGCSFMAESTAAVVETSSPVPVITEEPTPQHVQIIQEAMDTGSPVPTAIPTPSPTPTPSPMPTATPTPSPTPEPTVAPQEVLLQMDAESIGAWAFRNSVLMYDSPSLESESKRVYTYGNNPEGTTLFQVSPSVETPDGTFLHVYFPRANRFGYVKERSVGQSYTMGGEHSYLGYIARQNVIIWNAPHLGYAKEVSREGYEACRVFGLAGSNDMFAFVLTEKGTYGYVFASTIVPASVEEIRTAMYKPVSKNRFDMETVISEGLSMEGTKAQDDGTFLYALLENAGLSFNPYYYDLYQKPFSDEKLYKSRLYINDVYNSMRFKLFNTSGWNVTYQGQQTQWLYLDSSEKLQRGDLVFYTAASGSETNLDDEFLVIFRGRYSGYVTRCGIYLGDQSILTVDDRTVTVINDAFSDADSNLCFDSGRRILPSVQDRRSYLIESMISMIYDRLGTPYDNFQRLGDVSYDCSGIVCWALGSMGFKLDSRIPLYMDMDKGETTAAGLSTRSSIYYAPSEQLISLDSLSELPGNAEDLTKLERGDLVFLQNKSHSKVGHVMVYLGNNTVIHSTTITSRYRGTLIAEIRPELQRLYYATRRLGAF